MVMAAATVMRLQTVVSREISPRDTAVVTVGRIEAGSKNNIIPESASPGLSVRSFSETVRERLVAGIQRVIEAEAAASNAPKPPKIEFGDRFPVTYNDPEITEELNAVFVDAFGEDAFFAPGALSGSEDVGVLATAAGVPLVYWMLGGHDAAEYAAAEAAGTVHTDVPSNHSPHYAPVIDPTLQRGVAALVLATRHWLDR
ncbi:hypothetical protein HMPREF3174_00585 [Trueperella sp. HMSC08H06]|nr:hypothetical protein HMPREF3174_00585 [Trueperella sp. HMSC08H06]